MIVHRNYVDAIIFKIGIDFTPDSSFGSSFVDSIDTVKSNLSLLTPMMVKNDNYDHQIFLAISL
jgi:hypothetical protein